MTLMQGTYKKKTEQQYLS